MNFFKKYGIVNLISIFLANIILMPFVSTVTAVETSNTSSPWTREKALHLAEKALIGPTPQKVQELYQAGSASAAVDVLFPSVAGPDRTLYDAEFAEFTGSGWFANVSTGGLNYTNSSHMARLYQYQYARDPYEAKRKLFSLFEDTFSVNVTEGISYRDVNNLHKLIYDHTLGNYKTLVKRTLLNDLSEKGDFAVLQFLNNLRQWDKSNPNENYARELLQLFLMGEYKSGDSKDNGDERNYSESDVAALARIVTGFWTDAYFPYNLDANETLYFTGAYHNRTNEVSFLLGSTGAITAPYYDNTNDSLDLSLMENPVNGNGGIADNTVDYIFAKRGHAIALFLADKLFRFYVHENPDRPTLEQIANQIESNNFEMFPTVKWLLSQDFMYTSDSMNAILYKNPLELSLGMMKLIHANEPQVLDTSLYSYSDMLSLFGWNPYIPGSIFGRDGFDANYKWYSGYTHTQWMNFVTRTMYDYARRGAYKFSTIVPVTFENGTDISMDRFIQQVEDNLLLGHHLPTATRDRIKTFLTTSETGNIVSFQPNHSAYQALKFPGVFALVLAQPEYILKTGYDAPINIIPSTPSRLDSASGTLIVIEMPGGYDWLHGIIKKSDYPKYEEMRTSLSGTTIRTERDQLVDMGDFYMNPYLAYSGGTSAGGAGFKTLADQGFLKVFHRVGTTSHSRDHFQAQRQMASIDNSTVGGVGFLGALTQFESNATNTVVLGGNRPNILQSGNYINLGYNDNRITNSNPGSRLNTAQKNQQINLMIQSLSGRMYPGKTASIFSDAEKINNIATTVVTQPGGSAGVGYNTKSQLQFAKSLLQSNLGKIMYLMNTGNGYDTHENELTTRNINGGVGYLSQSVTDFFLQVKDTQNITIVLYSEFGRTNAMNGTQGTDHGQGGGMFVITNNPQLQSDFPNTIYGNSDLAKERNNWMSPGIDYRNVYGKIISRLYGVKDTDFFQGFSGSLDQDLSQTPSEFELLRKEYKAADNSQVEINLKYQVQDPNFDRNKGSYTIASYGTGNGLVPVAQPFYISYSGVVRKDVTTYQFVSYSGNTFTFNPLTVGKRFPKQSTYEYSLELINNQFASRIATGMTLTPDIIPTNQNSPSRVQDSILRKYTNTILNGTILMGSSDLVLIDNPGELQQVWTTRNDIDVSVGTGITFVQSLEGSGVIWNGGFVLPEILDPQTFLSKKSKESTSNIPLSRYTQHKLFRVGPDTLGVKMQLSQNVHIVVNELPSDIEYTVLTSTDGIDWETIVPGQTSSGGTLTFDTMTLGIFAIAELPKEAICTLVSDKTVTQNGAAVNLNWFTLGSMTGGVSIDPSVGNVAESGSISVVPPSDTTTEYTLTASGLVNSASCRVSIKAKSLPTCSLTSSVPAVRRGTMADLQWSSTYTDSAKLTTSQVSVVPLQGSLSFPIQNELTPTLEVVNEVGTGSCSTHIGLLSNTAPQANNDSVSTFVGTATGILVLSNDVDSDTGDVLRIASVVTQPLHGQATPTATQISYRPNIGYCGNDTLIYAIEDSLGATSTAQVNIIVQCLDSHSGSTLTGSFEVTESDMILDENTSARLSTESVHFEQGSRLVLEDTSVRVHSSIGDVSLSGTVTIGVTSGVWNSSLIAPLGVSQGQVEAISVVDTGVLISLPKDEEISENVYRKFVHTPVTTIKAGGTDGIGLSLSGDTARISLLINTVASGTILQVFRSEDGKDWSQNAPNTTCIVSADFHCTFQTNHFSYFGLIQSQENITTNSSTQTITGPGGGIYMPYSYNTTSISPTTVVTSLASSGVVIGINTKTRSGSILIQSSSTTTNTPSHRIIRYPSALQQTSGITVIRNMTALFSDVIEETKNADVSDIYVISADNSVFLRSESGGKGEKIDILYRHDRVHNIRAQGQGYCSVYTHRGTNGYIPCRYIKPAEVADFVRAGEGVFVDLIPNAVADVARTVFVRSGPSMLKKPNAVLTDDTSLFVMDSHGPWVDVLWENGQGYIYKKYIKMITSSVNTIPDAEESSWIGY